MHLSAKNSSQQQLSGFVFVSGTSWVSQDQRRASNKQVQQWHRRRRERQRQESLQDSASYARSLVGWRLRPEATDISR